MSRRRSSAEASPLEAHGCLPGWTSADAPAPMLAWGRAAPFSSPDWLYEIKYDGFRLLACCDGRRAPRLIYRSGRDATAHFPELVAPLAHLGHAPLVLDGELIAFGPDGRASFEAIQRRGLARTRSAARDAPSDARVVAFFFDLLACDGRDLRSLPLVERKRRLRALLPDDGPLRYVDFLAGDGEALFEAAAAMGLEGVMAKRASSPYTAGRSRNWLKLKADCTGDFVVVGIAPPTRDTFFKSAVHLAALGPTGLRYAGRVGLGPREIDAVRAVAPRIARATAPCDGAPRRAETWLEPALICEVRYLAWTDAGVLRQPVFLRFRCDKPLSDCARHGTQH